MTSLLDPVFAHIEANRDSFVQRVMDYVRHPSISAQDIGIREVSALLVGMLDRLGLQAEAIQTSGHPMVMGRWEGSPGAPTVLLYGHYDVQPPEPLDLWLSPPFEPTIRDGRIYARGIGDNKGQHFAQLLAIESHLAVHGRLPCNVIVLLEGEEEIGSPHIADFVDTHRDLLKADLVITADGPMHPSGAATISYGVRGVVGFELRARTAKRDVHSGNFGGVVPNAIWQLVHLLATMKNPAEITIEGLHDLIVPPTELDRAAAARLPLDLPGLKQELGLTRLDAPEERGFYDRTMFHPTLTINGFHGGYGGPGMKTVLPAEAFVKCDIRLVEAMTPEDVLAKVAAHVRKHAPDVELVPQHGMLPSRVPLDAPFAAAVEAAVGGRPGAARRWSIPASAAACRTMSSPRSSSCRPSWCPMPMPMRPTTPPTRTCRWTASTRASAPARRCWPIWARPRPGGDRYGERISAGRRQPFSPMSIRKSITACTRAGARPLPR